jgi:cell wall-associated NlpC family hydrolase
MNEEILQEIRTHAAAEFEATGRECCGLIIVQSGRWRYIPCTNQHQGKSNFRISVIEQGMARMKGELVMVVHSHPFAAPDPTEADLTSCEESGVPWLIMNHPNGNYLVVEPSGYSAPLVGRQFCHGVNDCYTLIRDYYKRELGTQLPDFHREDHWWGHGQNLYLDGYASAGFKKIEDGSLNKHDVLLLQLRSPVPNHSAIYLGDGKILHHLFGRLSTIEAFDGYWAFNSVATLRHETLC